MKDMTCINASVLLYKCQCVVVKMPVCCYINASVLLYKCHIFSV